MDLGYITIDSTDPASIAAFWSDALGWNAAAVEPDGSVATCRPPWGGAFVEFVRVPEDKTVKNRMHLGCSAGSIDDLDAELARLQSLGASIAWEEQFPTAVAARYRT